MGYRISVILNASSGSATPERLRQLVCREQPAMRVLVARHGEELPRLTRAALNDGSDVIVAGGGDGTVNAVASELVGRPVLLGVLPLGTRNHFAGDVGVPLDLEEAVGVLRTGVPRPIDVGEINHRVFLLYAGLGLYPLYVRERERHERMGRRHTLIAFLHALFATIRRYPSLHIKVRSGNQQWVNRTPFVFITNNLARIEHLPVGVLTCPNVGQLGLYAAFRVTRLQLLRLMIRAWRERLREDRDLQALCTPEVFLQTRNKKVWVAIDGEVLRMESPLHARVRHAALRVLVPPAMANLDISGKTKSSFLSLDRVTREEI